jgi:hypothetical protein
MQRVDVIIRSWDIRAAYGILLECDLVSTCRYLHLRYRLEENVQKKKKRKIKTVDKASPQQ